MPLYQVREGCNHGAQRQYGPGAVVEMSEAEAAGFADKLLRLPAAAEGGHAGPPVQAAAVGEAKPDKPAAAAEGGHAGPPVQPAPAKRKR